MAYSIQYNQEIKRKCRREHKILAAVTGLLAACLLRIFLPQYLETAQNLLLPDDQVVSAFCEDFVNPDFIP